MNLYEKAIVLIDAAQPASLGVVLHTRGSTPQKAGAKALFQASGGLQGTLGGGCLEAEAQQRALLALDEGLSRYFTVNLDEVDGFDDGLICGGAATILTMPLQPENRSAYTAALEAEANGMRGTLLTVLHHPEHPTGKALWVEEGSALPDGLSADVVAKAHHTERPILTSAPAEIEATPYAWFVEPVSPPPRLYIVGAGHIGKALSHFASRVGFLVTVVDDRPAFANAKNLPDADHVVCGDISEQLNATPFASSDYVVIVTRGHQHDGDALAACVGRKLSYLGLIGSRRKGLLLRQRMLEQGHATEEEVARIVTPMGLDLGGPTVEEIALSIAAQLVSVRRKGSLSAPPLKYENVPLADKVRAHD